MSSPIEDQRSDRPVHLRTEYEDEPVNLSPSDRIRFSWRVETERRDARQAAYRIVVGRRQDAVTEGRGTLWDSGRVESSTSTDVEYGGRRLAPDETYYWSVKLWTDTGETEWAEPTSFGTALEPEDWRGDWITHQPDVGDTNGWRSQWRKPGEDAEESVQVDLGSIQEISSVTLHPAEPVTVVDTPDGTAVTESWFSDPITGFGFPNSYRLEISEDASFDDVTFVAEVSPEENDVIERNEEEDSPRAEERNAVPQTHNDVRARGRYIRITALDLFEVTPSTAETNHVRSSDRQVQDVRPWQCFALASLTVQDRDGADIARGASVETTSSVETDTWGRDHLVNGVSESRRATSSPQLRTEFTLDKPIRSARAHVAAVGYGEFYVNGERIGDTRLDPAWTDYEKRILYESYDISDHLAEGDNAFGLWLGRGWFSKTHAYWVSDGSPRARLTLTVEYVDGTTRRIQTDPNWQARDSPLLENDIYDGEVYDARNEVDGWTKPGFNDSQWSCAASVTPPGGTLRPERIEPMGVVETLEVEEVHDHPDGPILDFGQNFAGWLEINITNPKAGDEVTMQHAEALTEEGELSTTDLRTADATDTYIARGDSTETYEPRFTYHGFRYAQISGYPGKLDPENVTAKVVTTAMDRRGSFECSNEDLNQLQHNSIWGLRSNTHSIPEDCPQRDERFGWTGDAHISTRSLLFNFDGVRFDEKWIRDHEDVASEMGYVPDVIPNKSFEDPADPTWSITRVMIPWYLYQHDGDEGILNEQYEGMREYIDYWYSVTDDGIVPDDYGKFGDWLTFENNEGRRGLPHDLFNTAFLYQVLDTFAKIAAVTGNEADAEDYRGKAEHVADAFNDRYFDSTEGTYGPGTQSSYSVPLFLGLVPEAKVDLVASNLAAKVREDGGKLQTGFLGTRPLIHTLADHGYADLAYEVVSQPEQPGWVYMARNGATTMWERWNSDESVGSGMNSLNHSPYTHVSEFFYEVLAGIKLGDEPVTKHVTIEPAILEDLSWTEASVETRSGELAVEWQREEGQYDLSVTIPWNVQATVRLPAAADEKVTESDVTIDEDVEGVHTVRKDGDTLVVEAGSGSYEFSVTQS